MANFNRFIRNRQKARRERILAKKRRVRASPEGKPLQEPKITFRNLGLAGAAGAIGCAMGAGYTIYFRKSGSPVTDLTIVKRELKNPVTGAPAESTSKVSAIERMAAPEESDTLGRIVSDTGEKVTIALAKAGFTNARVRVEEENGILSLRLRSDAGKFPAELSNKISQIYIANSNLAYSTHQAIESKVSAFQRRHKLYSETKERDFLGKGPVNPNQLAADTAAGGAVALGATLLGVLGLEQISRARRRLADFVARRKPELNRQIFSRRKKRGRIQGPLPANVVTEAEGKTGGAKPTVTTSGEVLSAAERQKLKDEVAREQEKTRRGFIKRALKQRVPRDQIPRLIAKSKAAGLGGPQDYGRMDALINETLSEQRKVASPAEPNVPSPAAPARTKLYIGRLTPMKGEELLRVLGRLGFHVTRQEASHKIVEGHGKSAPVDVHRGKDYPSEKVANILNQLGVETVDFINARYKHRKGKRK